MNYTFLDFLALLGSVGLFLYGMKVMSEGLQKVAGDRLRNILSAMTRNRFTGTLTGFAITALIQSSSASTVMVVSFVNAGLMTLGQSMAVIFGANVGTTFTAWVIAIFGFKVNISAFTLPMLAFAVPLLFTKAGKWRSVGEFLFGFAFLFMGLDLISKYVPDLQANPDLFAFLKEYSQMGFGSVLIFLAVGLVLTMIIQSSAATFAIVLIMCAKGWITFDLACAVVLGSNIGTTITPIIASLGGNAPARRTAMGHLLFNVLGTVWTLAVFYPFVSMNTWLTEALGCGNPDALFGFVNHIEASDPELYNHLFDNSLPQGHHVLAQIAALQMSVSFGLSIFHTTFNLINLSIMIWLTNVYVKVVMWLVPGKKDNEDFQLKFITGGLQSTSELNIAQAEKELAVYAERVGRMIDMAKTLVHAKHGTEEFDHTYSRLEKYEDISDRMQLEIGKFLNQVATGRLSNESKMRITAMQAIVGEIESVSDACFGVAKIITRKHEADAHFVPEIYQNLDTMFGHLSEAMERMLYLLRHLDAVYDKALMDSYNKEREINNARNILRDTNIANINDKHYEYQAGIFYMDIVSTIERTGDYIINIVNTVNRQYHRNTYRPQTARITP